MTKSVYDKLKESATQYPFLVHARNIVSKHSDKKNKTKLEVLDFFANKYLSYLCKNLELHGSSDEIVAERVSLLNDYYGEFANYDEKHPEKKIDSIFSAQSKFRSTVLEEFLSILLHDVVDECLTEVPDANIEIGSVKAYANLYFYSQNFKEFAKEPSLAINVKDQDFAIYRNVTLQMDNAKPIVTSVPVVAVECKTYIDKTMFEGSAATAEKLKAGNPYTFFGIVSETYEINKSFIPAYSRVDQIYILRKGTRKGVLNPIDSGVVCRLVKDVIHHLSKPWVDIESKLNNDGFLI